MSRVVIISLSSLLLVGLVAAVSIGMVNNWGKTGADSQKIGSSTKAVQAMCQPTDYKEACFKSLSSVNTDDPKELVKAAFESAKAEISDVANKSPILKELEKDPKTADAVKDCKELFQDAIDDLQRSFDEIGGFELGNIDQAMGNLKSWLSATITYQETCLNGFENTTGDASDRVRKILQTSQQMTSNGLAIVNEMSSIIGSLDMSFNRRRLLQTPEEDEDRVSGHDDDDVLPWMRNRRLLGSSDEASQENNDVNDDGETLLRDNEADRRRRRRLLSSGDDEDKVEGHDDDDVLPSWIAGSAGKRKLLSATNLAEDLKARANVVVAQDGSGMYKTIEEAIKVIPMNNNQTFIIYVKEGVYNEYLVLFKWMTNVVLIGDGPTKTRITNNKNFVDGVRTFKTATLTVLGDFFMAKDIGVENSAGAIKHQAVALRVQSDQSIFFNCHFDGYQDTLYTHTYRQFYRDCQISGTIDFVFGDAAVFFQNCTFVVRKPLDNQRCIVTAQGRMDRHQPTGIIIHRSRVVADPEYFPVRHVNTAYLGRPWKEYSKTIYMESFLDDLIDPDGWLPWEKDFGLNTCYYGEYNNVGPGSVLDHRVTWRGVKTIVHTRAESFMPPGLYDNDAWIRDSGIPYDPTLYALAPGVAESLEKDEDPDVALAPTTDTYSQKDMYYKPKPTSSGSSSGSNHGSGSSSGSNHGSGSSSSSGQSNGQAQSQAQVGTAQQVTGSSSSSYQSNGQAQVGTAQQVTGSASSSYQSNGQAQVGTAQQVSGSLSGSVQSNGQAQAQAQAQAQIPTQTQTEVVGQTTTTLAPSTLISVEVPVAYTSPSPAPAPTPTPTPAPSQIPILDQSATPIQSPISAPKEEKTVIKSGFVHELERLLMSNEEEEVLDSQDDNDNTPISNIAQAPTTDYSPSPSPSFGPTSSPSSSPSQSPKASLEEVEQKREVTVHDLERFLMSAEDIPEDETTNDDMSGNVPDGDEPSPATVPSPSPAQSPSEQSPSPSPSDEVSDWLPPVEAPGPNTDEPADKVSPVGPPADAAHNAAGFTKFEFPVVLSGMALWAALAA